MGVRRTNIRSRGPPYGTKEKNSDRCAENYIKTNDRVLTSGSSRKRLDVVKVLEMS